MVEFPTFSMPYTIPELKILSSISSEALYEHILLLKMPLELKNRQLE
jgi:hypothetical protein